VSERKREKRAKNCVKVGKIDWLKTDNLITVYTYSRNKPHENLYNERTGI
jgi:hypothetical protein